MIDVLLAVLPVTIFYKLKMARGKKIGLCVLLGLGLLAAICGAIKIKFLTGLTARSDLTCKSSPPLIHIHHLSTHTRLP